MKKFFIKVLISAAVSYGLAHLLSGFHVSSVQSVLIFALVLAVLNALVRPVLILLTLPITIFTVGLFLLVINTLMVLLADRFTDGVKVDGFWWALFFSILLSIISTMVEGFIKKDDD